jgi:hypothetical protein
MNKTVKKVVLFITSPIWFMPLVIWEIVKLAWEEVSRYVERKEK